MAGADTSFSAGLLARRTLERRAVEAAIWGLPLVSVDAMRQAFLRDARAKYSDIAFLSRQADWHFQVAAPNASSLYVYIPLWLKPGPVVIDLPPAIGAGLFGNINDAWQAPEADVGPTGEDGGKGGKYLVLPPDHEEALPAGCIPLRMRTFNAYSFLRAIPRTTAPDDVARALELVNRIRVYPLAQAGNPPRQRFVDIAGRTFDGVAPFDDSFYDGLARIVGEEPALERDALAMSFLRSIGIERGRLFQPDAATRAVLREAILEARAALVQATRELERWWPGSRWALPAHAVAPETRFTFEKDGRLDIDARAQLFFLGFGPARRPGAATFYVGATQDALGAPLDGSRTYRLRVPPAVPARQFWAVTVYDLDTGAFVREAPRVELNSYDQEVERDVDGAVEVWFGPQPPAGREANWIATAPGKPWIARFRFYAPEKALFDRSWVLPDIEPAP
jgi:hypothetical protein